MAAGRWKGAHVHQALDLRLLQQRNKFICRPIAVPDGMNCRHPETRLGRREPKAGAIARIVSTGVIYRKEYSPWASK
jgi:hypothetical protein